MSLRPHRYHPSGHITGFILNRSASHAEPIAEGGMYPPAAKGDSSRSARPGLNAARMFRSVALATPLSVDSSFGSLRPHCGCR